MFLSILACTCGILAMFAAVADAATVRVSPDPSGKAFAQAVAAAQSGDTLVLESGLYREQVRIDKPLTIRGEPGAILDGATPLAGSWSPAQGLDGAFTLPVPKRPYGLLLDGKFIAAIRFDRAQESGDWHWKTLLTKGTPLSGFDQIRALWMYHPAEKRIYLRLGNGAVPAAESLSVVVSDKALLEIAAPSVVVEGITLRGGLDDIRLSEGAKDCVIRRCTITSYENTGIAIGGGATQCTVEENTITRGSLEDWQPANDRRRENYEIWRVHKDVGHYDRVGIDLVRAGVGNRILRNRLDRVFDGICVGDSSAESLDKPLPDPNHSRGTEIVGNIIENTRDSGIELGTGCIDVNVHHNTLRRTHGGFRFKLPRIGPVYVHHNHLIDGTPFNFWFSMDSSPAEGYIYHNTIEGGDEAALAYTSFKTKRDFATPHWHVLNNLALNVRDGFFAQGKGTPPRDFKDSHNITTNDANAAIDAGVDLSTYRQSLPLPGCEPGYFKGKSPDAGAAEASSN